MRRNEVNLRIEQRQSRAPRGPADTDAPPAGDGVDIVEEWGLQSFPASDPPANW